MLRIADEHEPHLQRTRNGRVLVTLKSAWSDGTTPVSVIPNLAPMRPNRPPRPSSLLRLRANCSIE